MESWLPPIYMASTNQFQTYSVITIQERKANKRYITLANSTWLIIVPFAFFGCFCGWDRDVVEILRFSQAKITSMIAVKLIQIFVRPTIDITGASGLRLC